MEVTVSQLRDLLYPLEWFFRFAILGFVVWLVRPLYPGSSLANSLALYALWVLMLMMFAWQVLITFRFLRDARTKKDEE